MLGVPHCVDTTGSILVVAGTPTPPELQLFQSSDHEAEDFCQVADDLMQFASNSPSQACRDVPGSKGPVIESRNKGHQSRNVRIEAWRGQKNKRQETTTDWCLTH